MWSANVVPPLRSPSHPGVRQASCNGYVNVTIHCNQVFAVNMFCFHECESLACENINYKRMGFFFPQLTALRPVPMAMLCGGGAHNLQWNAGYKRGISCWPLTYCFLGATIPAWVWQATRGWHVFCWTGVCRWFAEVSTFPLQQIWFIQFIYTVSPAINQCNGRTYGWYILSGAGGGLWMILLTLTEKLLDATDS